MVQYIHLFFWFGPSIHLSVFLSVSQSVRNEFYKFLSNMLQTDYILISLQIILKSIKILSVKIYVKIWSPLVYNWRLLCMIANCHLPRICIK